MKEKLQEITKKAMEQIDAAEEMSSLNDVRVAILGEKGELTAVLKSMKDVKPEDRPAVGQLVNETRAAIEEKLNEAKDKLEQAELERRLKILEEACNTGSDETIRRALKAVVPTYRSPEEVNAKAEQAEEMKMQKEPATV